MSLTKSRSVRSDIHYAPGDVFGDPADSDPFETCRRQYIHFATEQALEIFGEFDKLEAHWTVELDNDVHVAGLVKRPFGVGAEQTDLFDAKFRRKIIVILPQQFDDLFCRQHNHPLRLVFICLASPPTQSSTTFYQQANYSSALPSHCRSR